jgi:hypothetical protein
MSVTQPPPFPTQDEREYYKLYRDRITIEDQLVYYRVSWLLISQSIMFSVWASAFFRARAAGDKGQAIGWQGTVCLAVLGILICVIVYAGILAAIAAASQLRREYDQNHPQGSRHPRVPSLVSEGWVHVCGRLGPLALPPLFVAAWAAVALVAWFWPHTST